MSGDIRFIDLFGGIGGFRLGLENASDKFECVDYIEYDKYAVKSYNEIFQEEHEPRDVTELSTNQIPEHDLICAGFPCQAFSVAGNRKGTDEARGKLFREIVRIAEAHRPEMLLLENVKGLLSQKAVKDGESIRETKGHAFTEILQALHELGYCLEWRVLNSKNWGVPQNRERVFIIGHLGGEPRRKVFPLEREDREDSGEDGQSRNLDTVHDNRPEIGQADRVYENDGLLPALNGGWTPQIEAERDNIIHNAVTEALGRGGSSSEYLSGLEKVAKAEGLNTAEDGSAYTIDASYWKGTSPGNIGSGRRTQIIQNHRNREIREHGQYSPTLNKKQGGGQLPMVLNHQFRPESRPSIENGQSGGSGLLYNSDYSYALSSSPHFLVDDSFLAMEGELREYSNIAPSQRSERQGLKVVEPCLTPSRVDKRQNGRRFKDDDDPMFTLTGQDIHGVKQEKRIRKLTPKECWRLQGFPDWAFDKAEQVNSDTQLYKQAGNSVTVNVIESLGHQILEGVSL